MVMELAWPYTTGALPSAIRCQPSIVSLWQVDL